MASVLGHKRPCSVPLVQQNTGPRSPGKSTVGPLVDRLGCPVLQAPQPRCWACDSRHHVVSILQFLLSCVHHLSQGLLCPGVERSPPSMPPSHAGPTESRSRTIGHQVFGWILTQQQGVAIDIIRIIAYSFFQLALSPSIFHEHLFMSLNVFLQRRL